VYSRKLTKNRSPITLIKISENMKSFLQNESMRNNHSTYLEDMIFFKGSKPINTDIKTLRMAHIKDTIVKV
jgi:hypothetical protein